MVAVFGREAVLSIAKADSSWSGAARTVVRWLTDQARGEQLVGEQLGGEQLGGMPIEHALGCECPRCRIPTRGSSSR